MRRELIVVRDPAQEAAKLFLRRRPKTLVLAGGRTPRRLYELLSRIEYPWSQVDAFFSDERCVPPSHFASNYRMAFETLLSKAPATAHRMPGETCDAEAYEAELRAFFDGPPRFDLAFLGIGADGHTASLFPGDPALDERERLVLRVSAPDYDRITLTLPALSASNLAVFLVAGRDKRDALHRVLAGDKLPAAMVAADRVVVIADEDAAMGEFPS